MGSEETATLGTGAAALLFEEGLAIGKATEPDREAILGQLA